MVVCIMKKILVGLSGGVDSAIAAYLLKEQWYEVVAGFMKNYVDEENPCCTTYQDASEAVRVAEFLWIELLAFDFREAYEQRIIAYIFAEYKKGLTPNPDLLCNNLIKFDLFLEEALKLGFDGVAMGHYARIKEENWLYTLLTWVDSTKDQSYFLAGLNQRQLSKALFPVGNMTKAEVRALAKKIWLPNAERKDSQGLCFIGNVPMRKFLMKRLEKKPGNIVDMDGKILGQHEGAYFYTIGQRQGLNLPLDRYVTRIDSEKNIVYVWAKQAELLNKQEIGLADWHWIWIPYDLPLEVTAKIRYRQVAQPATLVTSTEWWVTCMFEEKQRAIAPGQFIVAYIGDECIGSWLIV